MNGFIKICGLTSAADAIEAAILGATHLGLVFHPKSPRFIAAAAAEELAIELKEASFEDGFAMPALVGLFVDAAEKSIAEVAPFLTHLQLHGRETPERCRALRDDFGLDVIKSAAIGGTSDVAAAAAYTDAADYLLFDARPPKDANRPGGNGVAFNWSLLDAYDGGSPFFLAGGLTAETVAAAVAAARRNASFAGVDVSSGVEARPGVKDAVKLRRFIESARAALG